MMILSQEPRHHGHGLLFGRCVPELSVPRGGRSTPVAVIPVVRKKATNTLRDKLTKIGAKVVRHARYVTFQLAEVAVPRQLYRAILERIRRFARTPPWAASARRG